HPHGRCALSDCFRLSENISFAQVGLQIGAAKLTDYARRFGIGSTPALDLAAAKGQLSGSGSIDRPTLLADTSYGQGELLVSPLQMALVYGAIANGGVMPTAHYATPRVTLSVRSRPARSGRSSRPLPRRP